MRVQKTAESAAAQKILTRRALVIGGVQGVVVLAIAGNLRYLQVTEAKSLSNLAERNRINIRLLEPFRGTVFDRNGIALAENNLNYRILLIREQAGDIKTVLERLSRIIPMAPGEIDSQVERILRHREFVPVVVAENATWKQVAAVSANAPALPGVSAEFGRTRHYPFGAEFAHVVGYVGPVNSAEQEDNSDNDPLLYFPDFQIGKTGLEKSLDRELRGMGGNRTIEVNVQGREMRELDRVDAEPGKDLQITIERGLQNYAVARLGNEPASAVLLDIANDQILASVSTPAFDPNKFVSGHTQREFDELLNTPGSPLINRPMRGVYPPGSTFKMVTALAALEGGFISPADKIECTGKHETTNRTFHCWRRGGHGEVDFRKGMSESCDVYYYLLAQTVGIEKIAELARRLGIGVAHDIPVPDVAEGLMPTRAWKLQNKRKAWLLGDTLNTGIGQGFVQASSLQLAVMTARIASGRKLRPSLLMSVDHSPLTRGESLSLDISEESLELVRNGMFSATNDRKGTAYGSRSADQSFLIAGKTGTSQIRTISEKERLEGLKDYEDLPRRLRDHALFCGFAPYQNPRYAVAVIVENGGSGSRVAAPIGRDLLMRAHYGKLPPLEAYPQEIREQIRIMQEELRSGTPGLADNPAAGVIQA